MEKRVFTTPLTNLQVEILKLFKVNQSEEELIEIRDMLANYFLQKATENADRVWIEKGYNEETIQALLNDDK